MRKIVFLLIFISSHLLADWVTNVNFRSYTTCDAYSVGDSFQGENSTGTITQVFNEGGGRCQFRGTGTCNSDFFHQSTVSDPNCQKPCDVDTTLNPNLEPGWIYNPDSGTCSPPPTCTDTVPDGWTSYPMEYGSCKPWDSLTPEEQSLYAPGTTGGAPICNSCYAPAKAICSNDQILNSNNDCVPLQHSAGFPDSTKKGIPKFVKDESLTPEQCISGTVYETTINYAKIVAYDNGGLYDPAGCMFEVFYCNDGLTWNKTAKTCEVPKDTESSDTVSDYISDDTKAACTSGLWAKSWTYDYCNQPLCYIALDIQDYNLQCNNKYIEYDCTSDYRVKTFKQVSCGEVAKEDFDHTDLDINPPTNPPPPDTNNDINNTLDSNVTTYVDPDTNTTYSDYTPITKRLDRIIDAQNIAISKINTLNKESTQKEILNNIKALIDKQPSKQDFQDAMSNALADNNNSLSKQDLSDAFLDALNRHDGNGTGDSNGTGNNDSNGTGDSNVTGGDINGYISGILDSEYSKSYNVFNSSSTCGSPSFDPDITFMGFTVSNPLPIMEAHVSQYYDGIKIFVILSATLLGLLTIFRR
ncbi:hypothetical protein LCX93_06555 [Sulfurimonas sp. SWIR-19]|uniref:hypothetical protein n=1 Tax=Sulfurimonas sp. SWIR-19 TaxID=2878390 RepID=UPI001CF48818|nr:hypothetical protein [Sulfurimonas sp. SWIR-19]UCM99201.1 hypothetical protein LCX93_06555 [Sulfurimonas sp. SWIR-19]